jgi:hypothetical protein
VDTTDAPPGSVSPSAARRCHDHKYDPITQREFYQLFAFFNNVPEQGLIKADNPPPLLSVPSAEQKTKLQQLTEARKQAEHDFAPMAEALRQQIAHWEKSLTLTASPSEKLVTHQDFNERIDAKKVGTSFEYPNGILAQSAKFDATQHAEWDGPFDADAAWTIGVWLMADTSLSCVLSKIEPQGQRRGFEVIWQKGRFQINLVSRWGSKAIEAVTVEPVASKKWHHLVLSYDGSRKAAGLKVFLNGKLAALNILNDTLDDSIANKEPLRIGRRDSGLGFYGQLDELRVLQRTTTAKEAESWFWSERLRGIIAQPTTKRSSTDATLLQDYFVDHHADATTKEAHVRVQKAKQAETALRESIPTTLVMQEMDKPRKAHVLARGQYDHPGETVQPEVPAALSAWPAEAPKNRLGLARSGWSRLTTRSRHEWQ